MASTVPLQRLGTIADIEQATVFLASAAGDFISGHLLVVDGGAWLTQGGVFNAASIVAAGKVQSDDKSTTSKL